MKRNTNSGGKPVVAPKRQLCRQRLADEVVVSWRPSPCPKHMGRDASACIFLALATNTWEYGSRGPHPELHALGHGAPSLLIAPLSASSHAPTQDRSFSKVRSSANALQTHTHTQLLQQAEMKRINRRKELHQGRPEVDEASMQRYNRISSDAATFGWSAGAM